MKQHCSNCGCAQYNGLCTNCHEVNYIEEQYIELGLYTPDNIYKQSRLNEKEVKNASGR